MNCNKGKKVVLMYHRVNDTRQDYNRITVNENNFRAQMIFLKHNYKVLSLDQLLSYEGSENVIAITFDDGFADFYTKAMPILEELELPATVFITTGKLGLKEELWTSEIIRLLYMNDSGRDELYMEVMGNKVYLSIATLEQRAKAYQCIRQIMMQSSGVEVTQMIQSLRQQLYMDATGREAYHFLSLEQCHHLSKHSLITVGAHTINHVSLGKVEETVLEYEVKTSIEQLESMMEKKIEYFAYPFGGKSDYSQKTIDLLKRCGIKAAFTTYNSNYQSELHSKYEIPRVYVGNWDLERFRKCLDNVLTSGSTPMVGNYVEADFYMGRLEDDRQLWKTNAPIIIWGTGVRGRQIREQLIKAGEARRILGFADNNPTVWETEIEGLYVFSPEEAVKNKDAIFIVYNVQGGKICRQLFSLGVNNVHWII